jgi:hypothetical protein
MTVACRRPRYRYRLVAALRTSPSRLPLIVLAGLASACRRVGLSPPLGLRREVPATAMRTRVRAPLAAAPPPSQLAVEPDAPQRPRGAGGGAVTDLLPAALHLPQRPIGTAERGRETTGLRFSSIARVRRSPIFRAQLTLAAEQSETGIRTLPPVDHAPRLYAGTHRANPARWAPRL